MHIFTSKGKRDPCADFMSDIIYLNRANSRMIATDKIHSYTKRLMYFFPHIISSIIIPRFEYSPTQWLGPNNDSASTEMKKRIRLLQYTRPNTDTVPCWWSLVMFHADKQWGARELRGPVCPTATHVSPPGSPLNFWYFTRHPAAACARTFPFFAFSKQSLVRRGPRLSQDTTRDRPVPRGPASSHWKRSQGVSKHSVCVVCRWSYRHVVWRGWLCTTQCFLIGLCRMWRSCRSRSTLYFEACNKLHSFLPAGRSGCCNMPGLLGEWQECEVMCGWSKAGISPLKCFRCFSLKHNFSEIMVNSVIFVFIFYWPVL